MACFRVDRNFLEPSKNERFVSTAVCDVIKSSAVVIKMSSNAVALKDMKTGRTGLGCEAQLEEREFG